MQSCGCQNNERSSPVITKYRCEHCRTTVWHPYSNTPTLCRKCAAKKGMCPWCTSKLND